MSEEMNPTSMARVDLLMMLNGTSQGEVINDNRLRDHKTAGGMRFTRGRKYDLIRYVAYLIDKKEVPPKKKMQTYEDQKEYARQKSIERSLSGREIGAPPAVVNPERRESCRLNYKLFCEIYFSEIFYLVWSPDHLEVMERIQNSVLKGGLFAIAMPRGFGKSTLVEIAGIWALVYGHRKFICMVGADEGHAVDMLTSIKSEFEHKDILNDDFPEVCHAVRALEGNAQRTTGQLCEGRRTEITWKNKEIILPTIKGSKASGSIIKTAGITGRIRGMKHKLVTGAVVRPDFTIVDDPQTDESANSLSQNQSRIRVVSGTILGLVGPGVKMAGFMPCTVIAEGDLADQMLNQDDFPDWNGFRTQMLKNFEPEDKNCKYNMKMWDEYSDIRKDSLKMRKDISMATEYYQANREAMDENSEVSWPELYDEDEISGLQHAMNLYYRNSEAFFAEAQNAPRKQEMGDSQLMGKEEVANKINRLNRNLIPQGCDTITAMVDVQKRLLFYTIIAWEAHGTGYIIDYGTYPDQKQSYFTKRSAKRTYLQSQIQGGFEAKLHQALTNLTEELCGKTYYRDDTLEMKLDIMLIDANWSESTNTVYNFCRMSQYSRQLKPSHGRGFGASRLPMSEYTRKKGDIIGTNWRMPNPRGKSVIRYVLFDTNFWKSWIHERLRVAIGGPGCLSLFGKKPEIHTMFSEHLTAEYVILTEGQGRKVTEFKEFPHHPDNDFLDCVVGCAVGASIKGVRLRGPDDNAPRKRKKLRKMSEILEAKRKNR